MNQCIGVCSICGGQVMSYVGAWMAITPPPPPTCSQCGAIAAGSAREVIPMVPATPQPQWFSVTNDPATLTVSVTPVDDPTKLNTERPWPGMTVLYVWPPSAPGMLIPDGKWRA